MIQRGDTVTISGGPNDGQAIKVTARLRPPATHLRVWRQKWKVWDVYRMDHGEDVLVYLRTEANRIPTHMLKEGR